MHLRKATPEDADIITSMVAAMVTDVAAMGGHTPATEWTEVAGHIGKDLLSIDHLFVIAERRSKAVGFVGAHINTLGGAYRQKRVLHISFVYVATESRRAGVAEALVRNALEWGQQAGVREVSLNVVRGNAAVKLYEKLGFSVTEQVMTRRF